MPRLTLSLGLAICIVVGCPACAQELTRQAKIERLLDLIGSQSALNQMFDQIVGTVGNQLKTQFPNATPQQLAQARDLESKLMDLLKSRLTWEKMRPEYVRIYSETYTDEEIDGLLAFFQSPAGQSYIRKLPALTRQIMAFSQAQLTDMMPDILRLTREASEKK